ncbi:MAG TPA: hypothetical protein VNI01_12860, partial [Elusimicrobiota bacterium]|nr:hypothetical protein [Elusimicrobiota bacterium]
MKAGKYFKGVIAVAVAVSMTSTPALQAAQTVARTGPGAAAAPAISAPLPGGLAAPEPGLAPALGALDGGLIAPASNAAPLSAAEAPPLPGADAALEPGVSYFQAPLNPALPSVGATARGELSSPAAIAQAVQKEGPPVNVWLALKDGGSSGALSFVVDPRIVPMLKDLGPDEAAAFLGKLFHEAPFAHGEDLRPLSKSKEPVTIALLDRSQSLFESHPEQRMIGVNRALFEAVKDPAVRGNLLLTGLSHELHQLADPAVSEQTLTELDARLFVHLSKSPWESAADWAAQALGGALAPNT